MRSGKSLVDLAAAIEANRELKHDVIADTRAIGMFAQAGKKLVLHIPEFSKGSGPADLPILDTAHSQIASRLKIPAAYYDRMRADAPDLLATNVNRWFTDQPEKRMIRTLGGDVRAFVSNRYQRIENEEIAEVALPILLKEPGLRIVSCELTDRRMYIQAVTDRVQGEVKRGDVVQAGLIISNSEIGHGSVSVSPLIYRLVCLNGMISADGRMRAYHVGRAQENEEIWADDTRKADDRAVLLKVRDSIKAALDDQRFQVALEKLRGLPERKIAGDPAKAVEVLAKKIGATDGERGGILRSLIEGGDLSAWGLVNAVTHQAHSIGNYDRAVEFEAMGGAVVELSPKDWREIAEAA